MEHLNQSFHVATEEVVPRGGGGGIWESLH